MFEDSPNVNTNPLPNHASGSGLVNMLEVEHLRSLRVPIDRIYQMMVNTRYEGLSVKCCKHYSEEGHLISQCKGFCNKGMQMINQGLLRVEKTTSEDVFIMKALTKKVCRVQSLQVGHSN